MARENHGSFFVSSAQMRKYRTEHQLETAHDCLAYCKELMREVAEPPAESDSKPAQCTVLTHDWIVSPHMARTKVCTVCGSMAELDTGEQTYESLPEDNDYQPWADTS